MVKHKVPCDLTTTGDGYGAFYDFAVDIIEPAILLTSKKMKLV
jgi:hypothetical protein